MGRSFVIVIGFALQTLAFAHPRSRVYDVTPLLTDPSPTIPLLGTKFLKLKNRFTAGAKILFEDKFPGANWGHPAVFRVVGRDGTVLEEQATLLPPRNLDGAVPLGGGDNGAEPKPIRFEISDLQGQRKVKDPSKFFALMINGQADQRHWNDSSFLFRVLTQVYGYSKQNILVADSLSKEKASDLDGDGSPDILYESTVPGIKKAVDHLAQVMRKEDHLLIAVNDHGTIDGADSQILLADKELKAKDFVALLQGLNSPKLLFIYAQCFSGGFVRPSVSPEAVAISAATNTEFSWATEDLAFDEFLYHLISAFAGQTHDGKLLKTSLNREGRISVKEAFAFALAHDKTEESPLLEAAANSDLAQKIGFGF